MVADSELILDELRGSEHEELAFRHHADSISEQLCFF